VSDARIGDNVLAITGSVSSSSFVVVGGSLTVMDVDARGGITGTSSTTLTIISGTVSETLSKTLTVSLPVVTNTALTVTLSHSTFPAGYSMPSSVVIGGGQSSTTFTVQTASDGLIGDNTFVISGTVSVPNMVVSSGSLVVYDVDAQGGITGTGSTMLTISSGTVSETLSKTLTVSLPIATNTALTVTLSHSSFPSGYSMPSSVVIAGGQSSTTFMVQTASDSNVGDTSYSITGSVGIPNILVSSGTLTVTDVDIRGGISGTGSTTLTVSSAQVNEGSSVVLRVSLPGLMKTNTGLVVPLTVSPAFVSGYMVDNTSVSGSTGFTVFIPAGQNGVSYTLVTASDTNVGDNIFQLSGAMLSGYTFSVGTLTVINTDAKRTPVLSITSASTTLVGGSITASISTSAILSSGGVVTYSINGGSGSATLDPTTHVIKGLQAGTVILTVTSLGDTNYHGVTTTQTITIGKSTPTLVLSALSSTMNVGGSLTIDGISIPAAGSITSTGIISYSIISGSNLATITSGGMLQASSSGVVVIEAVQGSDANYYSPLPATISITINAGMQTLTLSSGRVLGLAGSITATAQSSAPINQGGTITYELISGSGSATIDPVTHVIRGVQLGTVTLTARTLGDSDYQPAAVSQLLTVVTVSVIGSVTSLTEGSSATFRLVITPTGVTFPEDLVFNLNPTTSSVSRLVMSPATVVISQGSTSASFVVTALPDGVLFNEGSSAITVNNIAIGAVSLSLEIVDGTSLKPENRVIRLRNGTIYQSGDESIEVYLPSGITTAVPLTIGLELDRNQSELRFLNGEPVFTNSVTILPENNSTSFVVTASSNDDRPSRIIIGVTSVTMPAGAISFSPTLSVITVLNKKITIQNIVSPHGTNPCWLLENIEEFSDNTVTIVDRWGVKVYKAAGYNNNGVVFCGQSNQNYDYVYSGPYYYIIRFKATNANNGSTEETVVYGNFELRR